MLYKKNMPKLAQTLLIIEEKAEKAVKGVFP
jgi:hypothetical protein